MVGSPDSDPSAAPEDDSDDSGAFVGESFGRGEMIRAAISIRLMSAVLSLNCCHSGCSLAGICGPQVKIWQVEPQGLQTGSAHCAQVLHGLQGSGAA